MSRELQREQRAQSIAKALSTALVYMPPSQWTAWLDDLERLGSNGKSAAARSVGQHPPSGSTWHRVCEILNDLVDDRIRGLRP